MIYPGRPMMPDIYPEPTNIVVDDRPNFFDRMGPDFDPKQRSYSLLSRHLTRRQHTDFIQMHRFSVYVRRPEGIGIALSEMWILHSYSHCVIDPRLGIAYCAVCPEVPLYDQLLTLKLILENEPETFFRVAHQSYVRL